MPLALGGALDWARDGARWPHREHSRFVDAAGLRWHVQAFDGPGPDLLLLHGTGASTHSWRGLLPLLARRFRVVAPDLPGHAFSTRAADPRAMGLPGMARGVAALLERTGTRPVGMVGHSAGAAIALRMALDGLAAPRVIVGLNAALRPFGGSAAPWLAPAARAVAALPGLAPLVSHLARHPVRLQRLIDGTGSRLDDEGRAFYARLAASPAHVDAALAMMRHWDLPRLAADLPRLRVPLHLLVGSADAMVAPADADELRRRLGARVTVERLAGLGHLAHEEQPARIARRIAAIVRLSVLSRQPDTHRINSC